MFFKIAQLRICGVFHNTNAPRWTQCANFTQMVEKSFFPRVKKLATLPDVMSADETAVIVSRAAIPPEIPSQWVGHSFFRECARPNPV